MTPKLKFWCEWLANGKTVQRINDDHYRAVGSERPMTHSIALALERGRYIEWGDKGGVEVMIPTDKCKHEIKRGK